MNGNADGVLTSAELEHPVIKDTIEAVQNLFTSIAVLGALMATITMPALLADGPVVLESVEAYHGNTNQTNVTIEHLNLAYISLLCLSSGLFVLVVVISINYYVILSVLSVNRSYQIQHLFYMSPAMLLAMLSLAVIFSFLMAVPLKVYLTYGRASCITVASLLAAIALFFGYHFTWWWYQTKKGLNKVMRTLTIDEEGDD